jgi:hypothetical protein
LTFVGVRFLIDHVCPGEALHEIMCPADDAHLTPDFSDRVVLPPVHAVFERRHTHSSDGVESSSGRLERFLLSGVRRRGGATDLP